MSRKEWPNIYASILNLYDFADYAVLQEASRIVLDYNAAKFAVGSNQGRRIVPFRRLMETNRFEIFGPNQEGAMRPRRVTDFGGGADHMVAAMLLFTGQSQQLPGQNGTQPMPNGERFASIASAAEMTWEATSRYFPHDIIVQLSVDKSKAFDQRVHHAGFEVFSSGPGYLITAGGIRTPNGLGMSFTPLGFNVPPPFRTVSEEG